MAKKKTYPYHVSDADYARLEELRLADKPLKKEVLKNRVEQLKLSAAQKKLNAQRQKAADAYNAFREELLGKGADPFMIRPRRDGKPDPE